MTDGRVVVKDAGCLVYWRLAWDIQIAAELG